MNNSIYQIKNTKSKVTYDNITSNIEDYILKRFRKGYIICWLHQSVIFGKIENNKVIFNDNNNLQLEKYLIECRVFNEKEELKIWLSDGGYISRHRIDDEGSDCDIIEAEQIMLGTKCEKVNNNFYKVSEERGVEYYIPSELLNGKNLNPHARLVLTCRYYIDYNQLGQAGYIDNRFLKIEVKEV